MKKPNNRYLALALIGIYSLTVFASVCNAADINFPDTNGHWAEMYISRLAEMGAISGMTDGNFYPDNTVTYAQLVRMIISSKYGIIDPIDDYWASGYISKAAEIGIIEQHETDKAIMEQAINRMETARIITNSLLIILEEEFEPNTSAVEEFEDIDKGCHLCLGNYHNNVGQPYVKGIISGRPGPVFDAEAFLTRAEASVVIVRMLDPSTRDARY